MPTSVQEKRQPFSKGIIRFLEYCCYLGIQVFRLLFARGLRIPPYLRCCAYTWPCAMHRVPGRLRTCAERRLGGRASAGWATETWPAFPHHGRPSWLTST